MHGTIAATESSLWPFDLTQHGLLGDIGRPVAP